MEMTITKHSEPVLLSVAEVVTRTGLGRSTVLKEMYSGRMRSVKVGARRLVHPEDLTDWIERLREQPDKAA